MSVALPSPSTATDLLHALIGWPIELGPVDTPQMVPEKALSFMSSSVRTGLPSSFAQMSAGASLGGTLTMLSPHAPYPAFSHPATVPTFALPRSQLNVTPPLPSSSANTKSGWLPPTYWARAPRAYTPSAPSVSSNAMDLVYLSSTNENTPTIFTTASVSGSLQISTSFACSARLIMEVPHCHAPNT